MEKTELVSENQLGVEAGGQVQENPQINPDGQWVKQVRAQAGMSRKQLAAWLQVDVSYISKMERAESLTQDHLRKLRVLAKAQDKCPYCWFELVPRTDLSDQDRVKMEFHDCREEEFRVPCLRSPRDLSGRWLEENELWRQEAITTPHTYGGPKTFAPCQYGHRVKYCPHCLAPLVPALCPACKFPVTAEGGPVRGCAYCGEEFSIIRDEPEEQGEADNAE